MALHTGQQTYISLYTGGGGLDLGFRLANPEAKCVLYVERELPAAALVVDHIEAGLMDAAPVWSDTGTLDCRPFADKVDWIIGGFPCQPFSVAGNRKGTDDERWLWEHIRRLAVEIRPRFLWLENTPGVLVRDGIGTVLGELSEIGYDAEWMCVRASDVGAPHRRERVFIMAHSKSERPGETGEYIERPSTRATSDRTALANSSSPGLQRGLLGRGTNEERRAESDGRTSTSNEPMGNARSEGREGSYNDGETSDRIQQKPSERRSELASPVSKRGRGWHTGGEYAEHAFPPGPGAGAEWRDVISRRPDLAPAVENTGQVRSRGGDDEDGGDSTLQAGRSGRQQETPEPAVRGVADGLARGLARSTQLRILGNGVVPQQAALAFQILKERN